MRAAIVLAVVGALGMFALIGRAIAQGSFGPEGSILFALAWGKVTLADLYVGFALFSGWVVFREKHLARALGFVVLVLTLGNAFTAVYVLVALLRSRGSWARFWLGHRAELSQGRGQHEVG
jgi:hypothetical protein